jgi:hypothetical protein
MAMLFLELYNEYCIGDRSVVTSFSRLFCKFMELETLDWRECCAGGSAQRSLVPLVQTYPTFRSKLRQSISQEVPHSSTHYCINIRNRHESPTSIPLPEDSRQFGGVAVKVTPEELKTLGPGYLMELKIKIFIF